MHSQYSFAGCQQSETVFSLTEMGKYKSIWTVLVDSYSTAFKKGIICDLAAFSKPYPESLLKRKKS